MTEQKKYLITQDTAIAFYVFFLILIIFCLVFSEHYFRTAKEYYFQQQSELIKLQEDMNLLLVEQEKLERRISVEERKSK